MDDDVRALEEVRQTVGLGEEIALDRIEVIRFMGRFEVASEPGAQIVERDDPVPALSRSSTRFEPMNPAPPVTTTRIPILSAINWRRL